MRFEMKTVGDFNVLVGYKYNVADLETKMNALRLIIKGGSGLNYHAPLMLFRKPNPDKECAFQIPISNINLKSFVDEVDCKSLWFLEDAIQAIEVPEENITIKYID